TVLAPRAPRPLRTPPELGPPGVSRVPPPRIAPGVIEHGSPFAELDLTSDTAPRARVEAFAGALEWAGLHARVQDGESATLWAKMAFLAPFALLTTRYGVPVGDVRTLHRAELTALVEETAAVGRACGAPTDPATALARYDAFPAATRSSMQRDAEAGRTLELDAIGGALLRAAERTGVPVPVAGELVRHLTPLAGTDD
ncbi:ketopantoate reductase family protein, partial [Streptomyces sp. NPDC127077]|uniref:ketopantoate reductase family protein n=1 Tax=Streptomyces sp. NPDC127077 TaxID=3347131 RepID=UPI0036649930